MSRKQRSRTARPNRQLFQTIEHLEIRRLLASPIVITKGGTYSGTWESQNANTAAVLIKTTEPVIIENSTIRSRGDLIESGVSHTNITVRNTAGYALNPNVYGKLPGQFFTVEVFDNVILENNYMEGTTGINLLSYAGDGTSKETIKIIGNKAVNIDGRKSDGNGGFLDFDQRTSKSTGKTEDGWDYAQFVQFDKVLHVPGVEIGWNEVINEPGKSRVEDVISMYKSSGTASSSILIHDNYIEGAYTIKPWQDNTSDANYTYDWSFSGGGIMLGDGVGSTSNDDPAYVKAYGNTVISTTNYGIALAAGHHLEAYDNLVLSAGVLPDGRKIANQNVGIYVWDSYHAGSGHFFSNSTHDNVSGWVQGSGRNDWWSPDSSSVNKNTHFSGTVTTATEDKAHADWKKRFEARGSTPPSPQPQPEPEPQPDPEPPTPPVDEPVPPIPFPEPEEPTPPTPPVDEPVPPIDFPEEPAPEPQPEPAKTVFSGTVIDDKDGDGVKDKNEGGLVGRVVYYDADNDNKLDVNEVSDTTDSAGKYTVEVVPGNGTLRMVVPTGWYQTTTKSNGSNLAPSESNSNIAVNLSVAKYATISGAVFKDADKDRKRDTGEKGLVGWTVWIDANNNGWVDAGERTTKSDANGNYKFTNVTAGIQLIRIVQKDKLLQRTMSTYFKHRVFSGAEIKTDNFGYA